MTRIRKTIIKKKELVGDIIKSELQQVHKSVRNERRLFSDPDMTDVEKKKRLLFLFQCDLLPGIRGQILESKDIRDNKQQRTVSYYVKVTCWCLLLLSNMGMIYYILLFALNQTEYRQDGYNNNYYL